MCAVKSQLRDIGVAHHLGVGSLKSEAQGDNEVAYMYKLRLYHMYIHKVRMCT